MWYLVVFFLVGNTWYPGDIIAPDGWSSTTYQTKEECFTRMNFMNKNFIGTDSEGVMIGRCQQQDPKETVLYNS